MNKFNDTPIFEIHNANTKEVIKIYKSGYVEGLPNGYSVVINRIPEFELSIKVTENA